MLLAPMRPCVHAPMRPCVHASMRPCVHDSSLFHYLCPHPRIVTEKIRNIVVIGSGNVAYHLVRAFRQNGVAFVQLLSRGGANASFISDHFHVPMVTNPAEMNRDADLYVLAVRDDVIAAVSATLPIHNRLVVHTSGATSMDVLSGSGERTGVFYPLQSFTFGKDIDLSGVPVCLEAAREEDLERLRRLALTISGNAWALSSVQRLHLHLAAVFAANFTHRMYAMASQILEGQGIPFGILGPLILETASKAVNDDPRINQTGPAIRKDMQIIRKHLQMLEKHEEFREIYGLITKNIMNEQTGTKEEL